MSEEVNDTPDESSEAEAGDTATEVVAAPVAAPQTNKEKNAARLKALKEAKARKAEVKATGGAVGAPGTEPKVKKERAPKAEKTVKPCRCGCGGQTTAFFVPGHDARWKGWMKKIELGKMEPKDLPAGTQKMYAIAKFTKRGVGFVPPENYNGEAYVPQCALEDVTESDVKPTTTKKAAAPAAK